MILKRKWNELSSVIKEKMGKRSWGARGSPTGIKVWQNGKCGRGKRTKTNREIKAASNSRKKERKHQMKSEK